MIRTMLFHLELWDAAFCLRLFRFGSKGTLDGLMRGLSRLGDGPLYGVLALVVLLLNPVVARWLVPAMALAFAVELPVQKIVKHGLKRRRPCHTIPEITNLVNMPDEFSFPSGHTAGAFIMAALLSRAVPQIALPLYLLAGLVGLSRVYNGVHYPGDVLMGFVLGVASAQLALTVVL